MKLQNETTITAKGAKAAEKGACDTQGARHGRWYEDACGGSLALELIGERWSLLVVREMLLGPRRFNELRGKNVPDGESSDAIRDLVLKAREIQRERLAADGIFANAQMSPRQIRKYCNIDSQCEALLERAMVRQGLSARAHDRILKVTRTIADLDASPEIQSAHIAEAVGYRSLDRTYWT